MSTHNADRNGAPTMNDTATVGPITGYRYRAVITCAYGRCLRCAEPGRSVHIPGKDFRSRYPADITHASYAEALEYGHGMNRNVYGSSTHKVSVQRMPVGEWEDATA